MSYVTRPVKIKIPTEIKDFYSHQTFLTANVVSGTASLTVKGITNFAINQILLIGDLGAEDSEIIKTHGSTAPIGTTITLASALAYSHLVYAKVTILIYDQIEVSHSVTVTGSKTLLTTTLGSGLVALTGDRIEGRWDDTEFNSGYYWIRYKNSITGIFSDYIGPEPYVGFGDNTVGFVIAYALKRNKLENFTDFVDYQFCIDEINACLNFITGKLKGWTNLLKQNYILGQTTRGVQKIALPSDIWESEGFKSILSLRIGNESELTSKRIIDFNEEMEGVCHTQVTTQATAGQTTLAIDNSYDFADSGSVNVYISGTIYTLTYTGVTRSATAGILTGIPASGTGAITVTIPVDTNIWYGEEEGEPKYFTVDDDGNILIWPLANGTYDNNNVYLDYFTGAVSVDSDADELDVFRYDAVKHWLTWAIRSQIKFDGQRDLRDGDYTQFSQILADYIRCEVPAHRRKRGVRMNGIFYR